ncbi:LOW QUALITY PROTEIN: hypothetical protein ACHAXM_005088 [Skeletonema potamos]
MLHNPQPTTHNITYISGQAGEGGNVFVLWGANLEITGGVNLVTKCKSVDDGISMKSRAIHHTCWLTSSHSSLITHHSSFTTNKTSYESPLSLNNSLHNWLENDVFHRIAAQDVFVQLNHRSSHDDAILYEFQQTKLNDRHTITITGAPEENLNPGLAISKFCRMAEQHPSSHPNGENLLLWLEKDWVIIDNAKKLRLEKIFQSAVSLSQRGVPYIGLRADLGEAEESRMWNCPAEGVPWRCTTAHQHRWLNLPSLIDLVPEISRTLCAYDND